MRRLLEERWLALIATVMSLPVLLVLWHYSILSFDDFNHSSRLGQVRGETTPTLFLRDYWTDYAHINGRAADAAARLVLWPGGDAWQIAMPLALMWTGLAAWGWLPRFTAEDKARLEDRRNDPRWAVIGERVLAVLAVQLAPFVVIALFPALGGDAFFTLSSATNYWLSLELFLIGALPVVALGAGRRPSARLVALTAPATVLGPLMHENMAFASLGMITALVILRWRRLLDHPVDLVSPALLLVAGLCQLLSPGIVARQHLVAEHARTEIHPLDFRVISMASGVKNFLQIGALPLACVVAVVGIATVWARTGLGGRVIGMWDRRVALLSVVVIPLWFWRAAHSSFLGALYSDLPRRQVTHFLRAEAVELLLMSACVVVPAAWLLWKFKEFWGPECFLMLAVLVGSEMPALLAGRCAYRAHTSAGVISVFLLVAVMRRAATLRGERDPEEPAGAPRQRPTQALLIAGTSAAVLTGLFGLYLSFAGLYANHPRWMGVERQIAEAQAGQRKVVQVPMTWPDEDFSYHSQRGAKVMEEAMERFYGLGPDVKFRFKRAR